MTAELVEHDRRDLADWRTRVLEASGTPLPELEAREDAGLLTPDEASTLATIRGIDFLLE